MCSKVDDRTKKKTGAKNCDELLDYQMKKVNNVINYVKEHSSFYNEKLKNVNGTVKNITELPFTYPSELERFSHILPCVSQSKISQVITFKTSGTTANPKRIFFTANDQKATVDFFEHGMGEFTSENDKVIILFPCGFKGSIGQLLAEAMKRYNAVPIMYGIVSDYDDLLKFFECNEITAAVGLPQQLLAFSRLCRHFGITTDKLHSALISADYASNAVVRSIEKNLGCTVYKHYGMSEMCFGGGVYSKRRIGYHMRHSDFLFEIINPKTNQPVKNGEQGEIVFTSFNMEAMPLIRYKTGDIASFIPNQNIFPVIGEIIGRTNAGISAKNGSLIYINDLDEIIFNDEDVLDYSAEFDGETLTLYVNSLNFNEKKLCDIVKYSEHSNAFKYVNIYPAQPTLRENSTMVKRKIIFCGQ